jgi:hypothetical protein
MSRIGLPLLLSLLAGLLAVPSAAQDSTSKTYVPDLNGRRVEWLSSSAGDSRRSQTVASINGSSVVTEQVEERVIAKEAGRLVIERISRRNSSDGRPLPPEKTRVETLVKEDGSSVETVVVYRGDLNGSLQPAEKSVTHTVKSGAEVKSDTTVERISLSGSFAPVERRASTTRSGENQSETNVIVYRPDTNGRMSEAARRSVRLATSGGVETEQTDDYENATTGHMRLSRQTVARTVKNADGSERKEVDVFGPAAPGRPIADGLQLRERQIYSRTPADGQVVDRMFIQRPGLNDEKKLSAPHLVSETVCVGKCK